MNKIHFIGLMIILISCSKEIDVDIPRNENPKFVVNSTIVPYELTYLPNGRYFPTTDPPKKLVLTLQNSLYIFDTSTSIINDALVLYYEDDVLKDTLQYVDSLNWYIFGDNINDYPVEGKKYSIQISKDGYETITANTTIPSKVKITNSAVTPITYLDGRESAGVYSEITVTFVDPINEINYYELAVSRYLYSTENPNSYSNKIDFYYRLSTNDNIVTSESYYPSLIQLDSENPESLLFTDKEINGMEYILKVYYKPPTGISNTGGNSIIKLIGHDVYIHLRNVTEEYYKFKTSMYQNLYGKVASIFYGMGEPLNVISNIKKGYGLFSGFNYDIVSFYIEDQIIDE